MRARKRLTQLSEESQWTLSVNPIHAESDEWAWWTYAGSAENRLLAAKIEVAGGKQRYTDGYSVTFSISGDVLEKLGWGGLRSVSLEAISLPLVSLKFEELLPAEIKNVIAAARVSAALS